MSRNKTWNFRKIKDFLALQLLPSLSLFNVTDESNVDETRVWRKYKIKFWYL